MKLTVLADNCTYTDQYLLGEPAFSCWLEDGETRVLFDTGYSDAFLRNAGTLGLPVEAADFVVLSHGHNDHTGGLRPLMDALGERRPALVAHPGALEPKRDGALDIGCPVTEAELSERFDLRLTREPLWLTDRLVFLGEIPELVEPRTTVGVLANGSPDRCLDDSALAFRGEYGLYVVTGCSHSGICNILEYAKEVTGSKRVAGVLGGFHLLHRDERCRRAITYLARESIPELWPCHCISFKVRAEFDRQMEIGDAGVGLVREWV